jgi:proteic killer suppression protein
MLNAAASMNDPASVPGNRFEKLRGALAGFFSIRINNQYRFIFALEEGATASSVRIRDYH